jgi:hypothetical protein
MHTKKIWKVRKWDILLGLSHMVASKKLIQVAFENVGRKHWEFPLL